MNTVTTEKLATEQGNSQDVRALSSDELDGVAGGFWFVVAFMAISLVPPMAGAVYGYATRGPKDGPSCPI
ncbi:MAG: hypothetical protein ACKVP3_21145 [Hyphomicrobiaceae bacterium]